MSQWTLTPLKQVYTLQGSNGAYTLSETAKPYTLMGGLQGPPGPPVPAGSNGYVLFGDAGAVGADSRFVFDKTTGQLTLGVPLQFGTDNTYDIGVNGANRPRNVFVGSVLYMNRDTSYISFGAASDLAVIRDAANVLAQRNGTNAQGFRIYGTYTDAANYERATLKYNGSTGRFSLVAENAGTGGVRTLAFGVNGEQWGIVNGGSLYALADNAYDIGGSGVNRPRDLNIARHAYIGGVANVISSLVLGQNAVLVGEAANVLALQNSANAQAFRVYNTSTNTSNFERANLEWVSSEFRISIGVAGTGVNTRPITMMAKQYNWKDPASGLLQAELASGNSFRIYNAYTDASNYERGSVYWLSNELRIGTEQAGTGVARIVRFISGGNVILSMDNAQLIPRGNIAFSVDNTYDIGGSGANRPRNLYVAGTITAGGAASITGAVTAGDFVGASAATSRLRQATVLVAGYVEQQPINFRFDQDVLRYVNRRSGVVTSNSVGFTANEIDILFSQMSSQVDLIGKAEGSVIEITGFSFNNSANTSWWPYLFYHALPATAPTIKMEVQTNGTTWTTNYVGNAGLSPFIMPTGSVPGGPLTGVRFTFTNIPATDTYIRSLGVVGRNSDPYQWNVMKGGDTMFGSLLFGQDNAYDIGSASARARSVYAMTVAGGTTLSFAVNNATKWYIASGGDFVCTTDGGNSIGFSNGNRPSAVYALTLVSAARVGTGYYTVATLPAASSCDGQRAMVSDGSVAAAGNFGIIVIGGGTNRIPVYSDGTNWRIG